MSVAEAGRQYRHYKGPLYEVIALAQHSETLEELVVYRALEQMDDQYHNIWCRPREMFEESIEIDGKATDRFTIV